jgi:rhodanese-related sulfurtransferase
MKIIIYKTLFLFSITMIYSLSSAAQRVNNPDFARKLKDLLPHNVPVISIDQASENNSNFIFLDAREEGEYEVSHIPRAILIGYDNFQISSLDNISKEDPIIVYCSIGYRSDIIGGKLKKAGYKKVYNLYGSIFEWVNQGHEIVNNKGEPTKNLHTYNRKWSKWVENPEVVKVY